MHIIIYCYAVQVSTPSGEQADRTMLSMLSCESVDKLGRRESFLKSTYESLGTDTRPHLDRDNKNRYGRVTLFIILN